MFTTAALPATMRPTPGVHTCGHPGCPLATASQPRDEGVASQA